MSKKVLHEPKLDTILMVEKAILTADDYYTRTELWKSLPRKIQYQTYKRILDYLEASGKIAFNANKIIYTGVNNAKLEAMIKTSVKKSYGSGSSGKMSDVRRLRGKYPFKDLQKEKEEMRRGWEESQKKNKDI